jgi:hypothetical protein
MSKVHDDIRGVVSSCYMQASASASSQSTLGLVAFFEKSIDAFQALILL